MGLASGSISWRVVKRLTGMLRQPFWFAVIFQGINGLLQVVGFLGLAGGDYLRFSSSYLLGNVVALPLVLNMENLLLGGHSSAPLMRYMRTLWSIGFVWCVVDVWRGALFPDLPVFFCLAASIRLSMAWANCAKPAPASIMVAPAIACIGALSGSVTIAIAAAYLSIPVAIFRSTASHEQFQERFPATWLRSATDFLRYLPHTVAGLTIGYLDRYIALTYVDGSEAESYLRTIQMASWATFLIFPVVFQLRKKALQDKQASPRFVLSALSIMLASFGAALALVVAGAVELHRLPVLSLLTLASIVAGSLCSQGYQVFSALNFVAERFGRINRITLLSGAVCLSTALVVVPAFHSAESMAAVFAVGWITQFALTVYCLRQRES